MVRRAFVTGLLLLVAVLEVSGQDPATATPVDTGRAAEQFDATAAALERAASAYEAADDAAVRQALGEAAAAFVLAQTALGVPEGLQEHLPEITPLGRSAATPGSWRKAAGSFRGAAEHLRAGRMEEAEKAAFKDGFEAADKGANQDAIVTEPMQVLAILLTVLAILFGVNRHPTLSRLFKIVPLLVFAYFVPTVLSNLKLIPISSPLYDFVTRHLLPASLVLLVLSVDIPSILRLGRNAVILFLVATATIIIGGPLALFICKGLIPEPLLPEAWKGLAALSGSWIGGGANFVAIGKSVGASANTMGMMVVVDVAVAQIWMIILLFFAGRERAMDEKIGADRRSLDEVRQKIETFEKEVSRPTTLPDLLFIGALGFGVTAVAWALAAVLPPIEEIVNEFTWVVIIVTTVAVGLSFTPLRRLEGAGASKVGSVLLYLLVASIGAHAQFSKVFDIPSLMLIGVLWMAFHAIILLAVRRWLRAPIFFAAVGSKANVGGAASAPILASAFHPSLAPVGVLLAVGGYVLGTYGGLLCAKLLQWVS